MRLSSQQLESGSEPEGVVRVVKMLLKRPHAWEDCVSLARLEFEKYFSHKVWDSCFVGLCSVFRLYASWFLFSYFSFFHFSFFIFHFLCFFMFILLLLLICVFIINLCCILFLRFCVFLVFSCDSFCLFVRLFIIFPFRLTVPSSSLLSLLSMFLLPSLVIRFVCSFVCLFIFPFRLTVPSSSLSSLLSHVFRVFSHISRALSHFQGQAFASRFPSGHEDERWMWVVNPNVFSFNGVFVCHALNLSSCFSSFLAES